MKYILKTKKETILFANRIAKFLQPLNQPTPLSPADRQLKFPQLPIAKGGLYVVALVGELGVGKTFFTKALGKALGVKETIKSPSFNLMKIYEISGSDALSLSSSNPKRGLGATQIKTLIHVDCYRLNSPDELIDIGLLDYFSYNNTLIVIEWADKVKKILPKDAIWIKFKMRKDGARMAVVS